MNKKGGLGKGLGALFGENNSSNIEEKPVAAKEAAQSDEQGAALPLEAQVTDILPNPYQPRQTFDEEKLKELAASIKEYGVVEPLIVRAKGKRYELVAGERRLRAAKLAGIKKVPIVVREYDSIKLMEIALIENIQRDDLNAIEEAQGIRRLMTECKLTQEQVAERVGRSRSAVTNMLRLLNMPKEIQDYISKGSLSTGQAKMLAGLASEEQQCAVARLIIENDWSARIVEDVVRKLKEGKLLKVVCEVIEKKDRVKKEPQQPTEASILYRDFESKLVEMLGTKVKVQPKTNAKGLDKGGVIQIEYYSADDLNRIYEALQPKQHEHAEQNNNGSTEIKRLHV